MDVGKVLVYVFSFVLGVSLYVFLQSYMITLNTSTWSFGGHDFVIAILPAMPSIFLIMLISVPIYFIMKEVK